MNRDIKPYVSILAVMALLNLGATGLLGQAAPPPPRPFMPSEGTGGAAVYTPSANPGALQQTSMTTVESDLEAQKELRMQSTGGPAPLETRPTAAGTTTRTEYVTGPQGTPGMPPGPVEPRRFNHENPDFHASPTMRATHTGWYAGVMAGVNIAQDTELVEPTGGGFGVSGDSDPAPMGGLRIGYTWKFTEEPIDQWRRESGTEGIFLTGSMEAELMYINSAIELSGAGTSDEVNGHTIAPMINFLLRGNWNKFSLYGGGGVGGAMAFYNGNEFADQIDGVEDDSSFDLALQGILGLDYYLDQDWAVFAEYKYFIHYEPELFETSPQNEQEFHLLGFGVKRRL